MKKLVFTIAITLITISNSFAQYPDKAEDISPLLISEKIPEVNISNLNGEKNSLNEILKEKRSILVFYRGGWCPYCNTHLSAIGEAKEEIKSWLSDYCCKS